METILKVTDLTMDFGGLRALDEIGLDVLNGETAVVFEF